MYQDLSLEQQSYDAKTTELSHLHQAADILLQNKDYSNLNKICSKLLAQNSKDPHAIKFSLECLKNEKNLKGQETCLENLFIINHDLKSMNDYSQFLFEQQRFEEALSFIQMNLTYVKEREDCYLFETYRILGNIALRLGDMEAAEEYYFSSLRLNSESIKLINNLASFYLYQSNTEKARELFHQALNIDNKSDKAWMGLALCHLEAKDSQLFWANIKNAIEISKDEKYLEYAAKQAMIDCEYSYILGELDTYTRNNPLNINISILYASLLYQSGRISSAVIEVNKLKALEPSNQDIKNLEKIFEEAND